MGRLVACCLYALFYFFADEYVVLKKTGLNDADDLLPKMRSRLHCQAVVEVTSSPATNEPKASSSRESCESNPTESLALLPERRFLAPFVSGAVNDEKRVVTR